MERPIYRGDIMIIRDRLVKEFIELVSIDSISLDERKMADSIKSRLEAMGIDVVEDDAGSRIGGNCGNLICSLKGNPGKLPILLMAHMDTVVPGKGKKPIVKGDKITSDGTTILGGDDIAGVAIILEVLRVIKENSINHGDIQVVFTVAEEVGLLGAKNLDYGRINARYGFVLDGGGDIGTVAIKAPSQNNMEVKIYGKAAHAGVEPEKGISAIEIAAEAISGMKLGRIDDETTANIGIIHGGKATNIVCDTVEIKAEARSRNEEKLKQQTDHMRECFENAATRRGGKVDFKIFKEYPSYNINERDEIIEILNAAARSAGIELKLEGTGGGSDTNIVNSKGIKAVDLSVGMNKVHSVEEEISINDMVKAASFVLEIIKNIK